MNSKTLSTRQIAVAAMIGAAYAVLTIALAPIGYGPVQFRVSEALCILPFFLPCSVWGLFAGCFCANLLTGNIFDILFGSLATLGAALLTARLGRGEHSLRRQLLACLMPVLFNALIVGAVLTWAYDGLSIFRYPGVFALTALSVGLGEAGVLYLIGFPLMRYLPKLKIFQELVDKTNP